MVVLTSLLLLARYTIAHVFGEWRTSTASFLVFLLGTGLIWKVRFEFGGENQSFDEVLTSQAQSDAIVAFHDEHAQSRLLEPPKFSQVGIHLDAMKLNERGELTVAGSLWQKIPDEYGEIVPGIRLVGVLDLKLDDPLVSTHPGYSLYRWQFQGNFQAGLQVRHFPIVMDTVSLHLAPLNQASDVKFLPDLASYANLIPGAKPGINAAAFIPGWEVVLSYFEFKREANVNTSFGLILDQRASQLVFNIEVRKSIVDPLISALTPIFMGMFLIFVVVVASTIDKEAILWLRTGVGFELATAAAILLVLVLAHIEIRRGVMGTRSSIPITFAF